MRKYKFKATDGNGGIFEGVTEKEHGSMKEALDNEIYKRVHSCLRCKAI
ncbi:hypothetical protein [Tenacibaculum sp. Bg11-29]|nr:hypothetical protein [Tenacibaculum sp. Bg11-29]